MKSCKNNYKKGSFQLINSCEEQMPYCCLKDTTSAGYCRTNKKQCSETGIQDSRRLKDISNPKKIHKKNLSLDEKNYQKFIMEEEGKKKRRKYIKDIGRKSICSKKVLEFLGPYPIKELDTFFEHYLQIEKTYLEGVSNVMLCKTLNKTFAQYDKILEEYPDLKDVLTINAFLKKYAFDTLFSVLKEKYVYNI